jgi:hypothetical protein
MKDKHSYIYFARKKDLILCLKPHPLKIEGGIL